MEMKRLVDVPVVAFIDGGIDSRVTASVTLAICEDNGNPEYNWITLVLHNYWDDYCVSIYRTNYSGEAKLMIEGTEEIWADGDLTKGWYDLTWHNDEDEGCIENMRKLPGGIPEFLSIVAEYHEKYKEFNEYSI